MLKYHHKLDQAERVITKIGNEQRLHLWYDRSVRSQVGNHTEDVRLHVGAIDLFT